MVLWFGDHVLDIERRELRRGAEPAALEPQVFDLLVYLVRNRSRVVSKDDLIDSVWGGRIVSDAALTTRLSRNTAFTYRDKPVDTKQIGRVLGVHYVLEGEVQRSGNRVRVTAQLIDAETDAHLSAERFDGDAGDLFALQE